jgi:DNA processing protein
MLSFRKDTAGQNQSDLKWLLVRNRVIAALATGTLVVEASQRSGAINTARHARDLHRRLMAVPGPVTSDLSAGCHHILREWQGVLVTSAAEVTENLSPVGAAVPVQACVTLLPRDELGHDQATVLDAMPRRGGSGTVRVAQRAGLDPATVVRCLGELSAAGFIERCDDGWRLRRPATPR